MLSLCDADWILNDSLCMLWFRVNFMCRVDQIFVVLQGKICRFLGKRNEFFRIWNEFNGFLLFDFKFSTLNFDFLINLTEKLKFKEFSFKIPFSINFSNLKPSIYSKKSPFFFFHILPHFLQ